MVCVPTVGVPLRRFHKLVWGSFGMSASDTSAGHLVGGADNGSVFVWNPERVLDGGSALVHKLEKHVGAVAALDINPFQVVGLSALDINPFQVAGLSTLNSNPFQVVGLPTPYIMNPFQVAGM